MLAPAAAADLGQLSIEELMEMEVTTVAKKPQSLTKAAAAVFVITREDIRRSGATSVPEALRLAPGVSVSRLTANRWAVAVRETGDRFNNKLLVMLDGRTLYTPLFAGVIWESQDLNLEEVERIEVIRGPAAAIWGANAVNGVINIVTRHAGDSQGGMLTAIYGTEERGTFSLRQGIQLGEEQFLRLSAKARRLDESADRTGKEASDDARGLRLDGRWDGRFGAHRLTLSGNYFRGDSGDRQTVPLLVPPWRASGDIRGNYDGGALVGAWEHSGPDGATTALHAFLDYSHLAPPFIDEERVTLDLELQRHEVVSGPHDWVWGLGYRCSGDRVEGSELLDLDPDRRNLELYSLFVQDEIALQPERWFLSLGARLEHNDITDFEWQPNARLRWHPLAGHSLWASLARATRTPSRAEDDMRLRYAVIPPGTLDNPGPLPLEIALLGNRRLASERLDAVELGHRAQWNGDLSSEAALFLHRYRDWVMPRWDGATLEFLGDRIRMPWPETNKEGGIYSRGLEFSLDWRPAPRWRLGAAYAWLDSDLDHSPHRLSLRLSHDLGADSEIDLWLRRASAIEGRMALPGYTTLDLRLAWRPYPDLELALVGQNLLERRHPEMESKYLEFAPTEVQRGLYVKATWWF